MRSHPMDGSGRGNFSIPRNQANGSPFEMGVLWGQQQATMAHHTTLLEAIATGVERMPERLALHLSGQAKPNPSWKERFDLIRVVVPALLIASLIALRILAPDAFLDIIKLLPHIPR